MNHYLCAIELKDDAKALNFAAAVAAWMSYLQAKAVIVDWRLRRRKLNLAANSYRDFLLEIDVKNLAQLDDAFRLSGQQSETASRLYSRVHDQIGTAEFALYRPFPDPERAERIAVI